jgi:diaminopimelate decarboxylase
VVRVLSSAAAPVLLVGGWTVGDQGKFGIPPGQAVGLAHLTRSLGLNPYGLAFHVGPQTMDPTAWDGPIRQCAQIMTTLANDGIKLAMLDVGGGFSDRTQLRQPGHHTRPGVAAHAPRR